MRLSRYFVCLCAVTCIALGFTHQKFLLIRANYDIIKHEKRLSQLLDHNKKLMYNVSTLESPAILESKLQADGAVYDMPGLWAERNAQRRKSVYLVSTAAARRNVALDKVLDFLTVQAEAQDIAGKPRF